MLPKPNGAHTLVTFTLLLVAVGTSLLLFVLLHSSATGKTTTSSALTPPVPREPIRPRSVSLTNARVAHWAVVLRRAKAFSSPTASARVVTTLPTMTGDGTQNIVLVLGSVVTEANRLWYEVRLAILPNNSIAWVPRSALGRLYAVRTHLYIDLAHTTATLKRRGVTIFRALIGVGVSASPTPRGQFYVRDKLDGFHDAFYGPVAFGTSARSAVLTEWPGGGYIGVHGTDSPRILPGRVSHGCIRLRNAAILALARVMPVGTPVTIS